MATGATEQEARPAQRARPEGEQMFCHVMIGSNDIQRSKKFYDALLAVLGGAPVEPDAKKKG